MKKILRFLMIVLVVCSQFIYAKADEDEFDGTLEIEAYSTAQYYWWRQDSSTFVRTESNGSWIDHSTVFYASKGQSQCFTPTSSSPTISININLAEKILAGGISYSPGSNVEVSTMLCDAPFSLSGNYQSQYKKMYAVYDVVQSQYYHEFGVDHFQYRKTGTLKVNTTPQFRHVKK